jgi:CheY-like chemotaxis protein
VNASPSVDVGGRAARILIVDDEADNREVMDLVLAWEGFLISGAASGAEALAMVTAERPDLILLDVMMPLMSGYEVLTTIKADPATVDIPVMMVTALADSHTKTLALAAGAEDFLSKPLDRDELVRRVRDVLRKTFQGYRESGT